MQKPFPDGEDGVVKPGPDRSDRYLEGLGDFGIGQ